MRKMLIDCPETMKFWDWEKNVGLDPSEIASGSNKVVAWKCFKGHRWNARIGHRTTVACGCPYCGNRRVCEDNCLATTHPQLLKEWHPDNVIDPHNIIPGSPKKVLWQCGKGHSWRAEIRFRTLRGSGCPFCERNKRDYKAIAKNRKINYDRCLATVFPHLAKEWHPTKNGHKNPNNVRAWSRQMYYWLCPHGHEWRCIVANRARSNTQCSVCNSLGIKFPELAKEWHYTKNGALTPNDVAYGSEKLVHWICKESHEWQARVLSRTGNSKSGCPVCCLYKGERRIANFLKKKNLTNKPQYRFPDCKRKKTLPFDFAVFLNDKIYCIEYQGQHHYKKALYGAFKKIDIEDVQQRDLIKKTYCETNNIPLLAIPYWDFDKIEELLAEFLNIKILTERPIQC